MKRILGLVAVVVVFFLAMNYFGQQEKIAFKGVKIESLKQTTADSYTLKGEFIFYNPSSFASQLGNINAEIYINKQIAGNIAQTFTERISAKNSFYFPFEIRFTKEEVQINAESNEIEISGNGSPNSVFFNYKIPMNSKTTISF